MHWKRILVVKSMREEHGTQDRYMFGWKQLVVGQHLMQQLCHFMVVKRTVSSCRIHFYVTETKLASRQLHSQLTGMKNSSEGATGLCLFNPFPSLPLLVAWFPSPLNGWV